MPRSYLALFLCLSLLRLTDGISQNDPKLAVVLSGGGAKGIAHIPLLRALDSLNVKPDLIIGTSMGAVMGGMYAMGYSADTIEYIVRRLEWDKLLTNSTDYNYINPSERDEYGKYSITLPFKKGKIRLPSGVIESQELSLLFNRMGLAVNGIDRFEDFPIPYLSIGADVINGEKVVIDEGSPAVAMRASMAIPTVFTPASYKGRTLVDGGVFDNFAVDDAIERGADVIIGSDVSGGFVDEDKLNNLIDIAIQSAFVASAQLNVENRAKCDLLIDHRPNLTFTSSDFEAAETILAQGGIAVQQKLDDLVEITKPFQATDKRAFVQPEDRIIDYDELRFDNISDAHRNLLTDRLRFYKETQLPLSKLEEKLRHAFGSRLYDKFVYDYFVEGDKQILKISGKVKIKNYFQGAIHYDTERGAGIIVNYTTRDFLGKNSRSLVTVDAAENPNVRVQHQQYLGDSRWWYRFDYLYESVKQGFNVDFSTTQDVIFKFNLFNADFQRDLSNNSTLGVGFFADRSSFKLATDNEGAEPDTISNLVQIFDRYRQDQYGAKIRYQINNLDRRFFPRSGTELDIAARYAFDNNIDVKVVDVFDQEIRETLEDALSPDLDGSLELTAFLDQYVPLSKKLTLQPSFFAGTQLSADTVFYTAGITTNFFIGGLDRRPLRNVRQFPGLKDAEELAEHMLGARCNLQWEIFKNGYIIPSGNAVVLGTGTFDDFVSGIGDFNTNWRDSPQSETRWIFSGGLTLGYMSPIGPIQFLVSKTNDLDNFRFYFSAGFHFL